MPNQDQPDQSNSDNQGMPTSSPVSAQVDLPPIPPEFQNVGNTTPAVSDGSGSTQGSASPSAPEFSNITKSPKKKFGGGKIIATILGIFMLVGGVGAGILLTQQQQLFQQKAASCGGECRDNCLEGEIGQGQGRCGSDKILCIPSSCSGDVNSGTQCESNGFLCVDSCSAGHNQTGSCNTGVCCDTASAPSPNVDTSCVFDHYQDKQVCTQVNGQWMRCDTNPKGEKGYEVSGCTVQPNVSPDAGCVNDNYPDCVPGSYDSSGNPQGKFCINLSQSCTPSVPSVANCKTDSTCIPATTNPPTSSPTAPYCAAIMTYDSEWNLISVADRSSLKINDVINFCVKGSPSSTTFDMARFTINGILQADTTTKRPSSTDFCQSYTIPDGITTVSVSAQIHHSTLGWF